MSDETDKTIINPEGAQPKEEKAAAEEAATKGGLLANKKLLIFGGGGLLVLILAAVGIFLLMGGDEPTAKADEQSTELEKSEVSKTTEATDSHTKPDKSKKTKAADDAHVENHSEEPNFEDPGGFELSEAELAALDLGLSEAEMSALDQIEASLDFLDVDPNAGQPTAAESGETMSTEDSLEEVNWLEEANAKLATREENVTAREKAVNRLEKEVSRKLIVIEQAESSRVAKLAKLYDGMDPRSVTKLMNNLDDDTVVAIISRMKQKNASQVLSLISPQRAARLSKKMITIAEN